MEVVNVRVTCAPKLPGNMTGLTATPDRRESTLSEDRTWRVAAMSGDREADERSQATQWTPSDLVAKAAKCQRKMSAVVNNCQG